MANKKQKPPLRHPEKCYYNSVIINTRKMYPKINHRTRGDNMYRRDENNFRFLLKRISLHYEAGVLQQKVVPIVFIYIYYNE